MKDQEANGFYGIVVACAVDSKTIAFGQVKNSLSGTSLSGNWIIDVNDPHGMGSICRSHVLISDVSTFNSIQTALKDEVYFGEFNELVLCIKSAEKEFRDEWENYLSENPKKAKTLVEPSWLSWPNILDINYPVESLVQSGKSAHPESTPEDMRSLIAMARMVRQVLDNWRSIEEQRTVRKFLKTSNELPRLWPPGWKIIQGVSK